MSLVAEHTAVVNASTNNIAVTLASAVPAGHTLIANFVCRSGMIVYYPTLKDSRDNKWRLLNTVDVTTNTAAFMAYAYVVSPLNAGDTVTISLKRSVDRVAVNILEFSEALTADVGAIGTSGGSMTTNLVTAATATTADANELVVGMFGVENETRIFTATNGFTALTKVATSAGTIDRALFPEYKYVSATGAYTANGTLNLSSNFGGIIQTFRLMIPPDTRYGRPKSWDGASWGVHDAKSWDGTSWRMHRVKGYVSGSWVGPYPTSSSVTFNETFERVPVGVQATGGDITQFDTVTVSNVVGVAGLHGTAVRCSVGATSGNGALFNSITPGNQGVYTRFYLNLTNYPSANTILMVLNQAGSALAGLQVSTTGTIRIRNGATLVATTATSIPLSQWVRIEWHYDGHAGLQNFRLFVGAALESTTPTETFTNQLAVAGAVDGYSVGIVTATTNYTLDIDEFAMDQEKWIDSK